MLFNRFMAAMWDKCALKKTIINATKKEPKRESNVTNIQLQRKEYISGILFPKLKSS